MFCVLEMAEVIGLFLVPSKGHDGDVHVFVYQRSADHFAS
jgi:hypothetical protein